MKTIVFIAPNGILKAHDFSLYRIAKALKKQKDIKSILVCISSNKIDIDGFDKIIKVKTENELIRKIKVLKPNIIFNRSWMHAYSFSARLVKEFDNVIVNIKDWNFSSREEYKFLFGDDKDFDAIEYIFKNAKKVLSHYTKEQAKIWAKKYNIDKNKFVFFPEYCNNDNLYINRAKETKNIKIVYAGRLPSSILPSALFPSKWHLLSIQKLTKSNIDLTYIIPTYTYHDMKKNFSQFLDFFYEDKFNSHICIKKGKPLDSKQLLDYHYGFFELLVYEKNISLFEYAIVSKFALYLEAGLPILVNNKFKSISKLVKKYNLGIIFDNKDIENLENIIEKNWKNWKDFKENIIYFRKKYIYNNILHQILN